jgi:hypothetical protein
MKFDSDNLRVNDHKLISLLSLVRDDLALQQRGTSSDFVNII